MCNSNWTAPSEKENRALRASDSQLQPRGRGPDGAHPVIQRHIYDFILRTFQQPPWPVDDSLVSLPKSTPVDIHENGRKFSAFTLPLSEDLERRDYIQKQAVLALLLARKTRRNVSRQVTQNLVPLCEPKWC